VLRHTVALIQVRRYLLMYFTPETLLNHVFEDLRKPKAPNRNRIVPWSGAPDCPVCHRTVSGAPGPYTSELFTFGFLQRRSAIIHRTVRCTSGATIDCTVPLTALQFAAEVRAEVRGAPDSEQCLSGAAPDYLVPLEDKAPTVDTARTLTVG
jgi:hypothetical protein